MVSVFSPLRPGKGGWALASQRWLEVNDFGRLVNRFGRMALKHVYYHMLNGSPVQVRCMIQDVRGWCIGMTQRDGMEREVGGGFRMGNTSTPVADSCRCMVKPIQYCKVISLQLK